MGPASWLVLLAAIVVLALGALTSQATSRALLDASMHERHERWMAQYGRVYSDDTEKERRFQIFKDNVAYIESSNIDGSKPYELRINRFMDLTNEEFRTARNRFRIPSGAATGSTYFKYENVSAVPSSIDWRAKGAVTPIKNQEQCGKLCAHEKFSPIIT